MKKVPATARLMMMKMADSFDECWGGSGWCRASALRFVIRLWFCQRAKAVALWAQRVKVSMPITMLKHHPVWRTDRLRPRSRARNGDIAAGFQQLPHTIPPHAHPTSLPSVPLSRFVGMGFWDS